MDVEGHRARHASAGLRRRRPDLAGIHVGATWTRSWERSRLQASRRSSTSSHRPPGRTQTPPDGVNGGSPNVADLADFATALATHYDGLTDRGAGRARLSGLERAEPQPDMSPVSASNYRGDGQRGRRLRARGRPVEHRRRGRARSLRPHEEQEAEVVLGRAARVHALAPLPLEGVASALDVPRPRSASRSGRITRTRSVARSVTRSCPTTSSSATCRRCVRCLKAGVRLHHIVSAQPLQFWVTEFGWNTKPPRTRGGLAQPRLALDGRVAASDVALGHLLW